VTNVPTGQEKGQFLAVDLGGSNCRVCAVNLHGDSTLDIIQEKYAVPPDVRVNPSSKPLFDFIAAKINTFLQRTDVSGIPRDQSTQPDDAKDSQTIFNLGFTFSFTCEQTALSSGTLVHWDKGWDIPEAIGKDPCALLQASIDDAGLPVRVCVLANDAVGTLLARAYTSQTKGSTLAGVIFGTGTNAAYVEKMENIDRSGLSPKSSKDKLMVINTEWGSFDDDMLVLPTTTYDDTVDQESSDPGCGMFEKRVSGMYLGELLRLMILELAGEDSFDMTIPEESCLRRQGGLDTPFLSSVALDDNEQLHSTKERISKVLGTTNVSFTDAMVIKNLAAAIGKRAARLAGASLAAVIVQSGCLNDQTAPHKTEVSIYTEKTKEEEVSTGCHSLFSSLYRLVQDIITKSHSEAPPTVVDGPDIGGLPTRAENIDIGIDGSLFEFYPGFEDTMRTVLREIPEIGVVGEQRVTIGLTKDGSGVGAALMAASTTI
jgi:hexokinase